MEYPKINSLFKRDMSAGKGNKCPLILDQYACDEFALIKDWLVTEKIDGTNIRIIYDNEIGMLEFKGRTDKAQLPPHLLKYLQETITIEKIKGAFNIDHNSYLKIIIYGEGYGPKIQSGGNYRAEVGLILFDIFVSGWWLEFGPTQVIADSLGVPSVPILNDGRNMTESEIIEFVKSEPNSVCAEKTQPMEGIVARANPMLLFRNGQPLRWKLKVRDFS